MSKVRTVAATIALMLGASVSFAQPPFSQSSNPGSYVGFAQTPGAALNNSSSSINQHIPQSPGVTPGNPVYVSCWAEVPSLTAYFSATFLMPAFNTLKDQFRTFV